MSRETINTPPDAAIVESSQEIVQYDKGIGQKLLASCRQHAGKIALVMGTLGAFVGIETLKSHQASENRQYFDKRAEYRTKSLPEMSQRLTEIRKKILKFNKENSESDRGDPIMAFFSTQYDGVVKELSYYTRACNINVQDRENPEETYGFANQLLATIQELPPGYWRILLGETNGGLTDALKTLNKGKIPPEIGNMCEHSLNAALQESELALAKAQSMNANEEMVNKILFRIASIHRQRERLIAQKILVATIEISSSEAP